MAKTALQTLSRIQKLALDEQRKILRQYLDREESLLLQLQNLHTEFEQEKEFARHNNCVGDFGRYTKLYIQKKEDIEKSIEKIRQEITRIRDVITDMYKEQKTYEIVDEERKKAKQKELEYNEQKLLDEIGTNTYIKNHEEN